MFHTIKCMSDMRKKSVWANVSQCDILDYTKKRTDTQKCVNGELKTRMWFFYFKLY